MSIHSSLAKKGFGARHRNVFKRFERIEKLKADERWEDEMPVIGLPKVKSIKLKKGKGGGSPKPAAAAEEKK